MPKFVCLLAISLLSVSALADEAPAGALNFRVSPISAIIGSYTAVLEWSIGANWTLGPTYSYYDIKRDPGANDLALRGYEAALKLTWFKNGAFTDGLYISPSAGYDDYKLSDTDWTGSAREQTVRGATLGALIGYGWFWSHFNIMLGVGAKGRFGDSQTILTNADGTQKSVSSTITEPDGEFSLGWRF